MKKKNKNKVVLGLLEPQSPSNPLGRSWEDIWRGLSEILRKRRMCPSEPSQPFSIMTLRRLLTNPKRDRCYLQILLRNGKNQMPIPPRTHSGRYASKHCVQKSDVQQHFNSQKDRISSQTGDSEPWTITQRQKAASVMVWASVTMIRKSPLVFVEPEVKINRENCVKNYVQESLSSNFWQKY